VRAVQLDQLEPGLLRATGSGREITYDPTNIVV
jgi:hypothetical protein